QARGTIAYAWNFDFVALRNQRDDCVAIDLLDLFGIRKWGTQANGKVAGEVVSTDGDHSSPGNGTLLEDDKFGGTGADIRETDAEFALIRAEDGIGGGQRLVDGVIHMNAGFIHGGNDVLRGAGGGRNHVHANFEASGHHAERIADSGLIV